MLDERLVLVRCALGCRSLSSDAFRVLYCLCSVGPERVRNVSVLRFLSGIPKPVRCLKELDAAGLLRYRKRWRKLEITLGAAADFEVWRNRFAADTLSPLEKALKDDASILPGAGARVGVPVG